MFVHVRLPDTSTISMKLKCYGYAILRHRFNDYVIGTQLASGQKRKNIANASAMSRSLYASI